MSLEAITAEWDELSTEYNKLEVGQKKTLHFAIKSNVLILFFFYFAEISYSTFKDVSNEYSEMLEKLEQLQQKCMKDVAHQRYRVNQISSNLKQ